MPQIPELQFRVLSLLHNSDEMAGAELRDELKRQGAENSNVAFYQLMARMEKEGWIDGRYGERAPTGRGLPQKFYRVTGHGRNAWKDYFEFCLDQARIAGIRVQPTGA